MTSIDLSELYPETMSLVTGEFDVVLTDAEATETRNGKPMIKVKMRVEGDKHHGHTFFKNFTISQESKQAMQIFFREMANLGFTGEFFKEHPKLEDLATQLEGKRARVRVEASTWQGVEREEVKAVLAPRDGSNAGPNPFGTSGPSTVPSPSIATPTIPSDAPPTPF